MTATFLTLTLTLTLLAQLPPDEAPALNAAILSAAAHGGGTVTLEARAYGIGAPLDGTVANVTLRGIPGATRLVKLDAPRNVGIVNLDAGRTYRGWTFEGI